MRLWILRPVESAESAPWQSYFDCNFGFVIRASSEQAAGDIAATKAGDEGPEAWIKSDLSTCENWSAQERKG
jgi:hypothetical protein